MTMCAVSQVDTWLNRADVQAALHANTSGLPGPWRGCSALRYSLRDEADSMLPLYPPLLSAGLRILIFSGTVDAAVPATGAPAARVARFPKVLTAHRGQQHAAALRRRWPLAC